MLQKWSYKLNNDCCKTFWSLKKVPGGSFLPVKRKEVGQNCFLVKRCSFLERIVSIDTLGPKKLSFGLHKKCQNSPLNNYKVFLKVFILDKTRKCLPKCFFLAGEIGLFLKNLCHQQPPRCYRKDLVFCTIIAIFLCKDSFLFKKLPDVCFFW